MAYLFLDTSQGLTVGVLNDDFTWKEYMTSEESKSSGRIHKDIDDILKKTNCLWDNLLGIIISSGPGSYTGMRVSEGLAQILELESHHIYSFYHFEVPKFFSLYGNKYSWLYNLPYGRK